MPLYDGAVELVRDQLEQIHTGQRVGIIAIGRLTDEQHRQLREFRREQGLEGAESPEIIYMGRHHYDSRIKQGYLVDDLVRQVEVSLSADAEPFLRGSMTSLRCPNATLDPYGKLVKYQAIFELSRRKPRVELYSVIPKGDGR